MGFDVHVEFKRTLEDIRQIDRGAQRAAMFAVRETGRLVKREMAAAAPRRSGRLRRSIKVSRSIGVEGGVLTNRIGPKTPPAVLYAPKIQALTGFADAGQATAEASHAVVFDAAIDRVIRRWK